MTYEEFKNKWLGKGIDYDGKYGFQCTDVYRMYCKEVLDIPQSPPVTGAKDIWNTYLKDKFTRIENTLEAVPVKGDIIIWNVGTYGHVAVCDSANKNSFISFEQNWVELNGTGVTELRTHNYNNVLGWLHFNNSDNNMTLTDDQKRILQFLTEQGANEGKVREAFGALTDLEKCKKENDSLRKLSDSLSSSVAELTESLAKEQKLNKSCQSSVLTAKESLETIQEQLALVTKEKNDYQKWYQSAKKELKELDNMTAIQHIIYGVKNLFVKKQNA